MSRIPADAATAYQTPIRASGGTGPRSGPAGQRGADEHDPAQDDVHAEERARHGDDQRPVEGLAEEQDGLKHGREIDEGEAAVGVRAVHAMRLFETHLGPDDGEARRGVTDHAPDASGPWRLCAHGARRERDDRCETQKAEEGPRAREC